MLSEKSQLISTSSLWANPPIGMDGPDFVNCAAHVQSNLNMHDFKRNVLRKIERDLGRKRSTKKFVSRPIDMDILIFNQIEVEIDIWRYAHLAIPLAEIHPKYKNSTSSKSIREAAKIQKRESDIFIVV